MSNEISKDKNNEVLGSGRYKIYAHVNKINGKIYIGQTNQKYLNSRFGRSGKNYILSDHFYKAIQKYGWDNFEHIVLIEGLSSDMANIVEHELIKKYNTIHRDYGYNLLMDCNGGRIIRDETRKKLSVAAKGRKLSEEWKEKIRQSNLGQKRSEEACRKMSIAKQNISDETRRKISEAGKGRKPSPKCIENSRKAMLNNRFAIKPIAQYTLEGEFIKAWECAKDVEKELGIDHGNIGKCCNFNAESAGGYQWRYFDGSTESITEYIGKLIKIDQYDLDGNYIKTWKSATEIEKKLGISTPRINKALKKENYQCENYMWRYHEDNPPQKYVNSRFKRIAQFDLNMNFLKIWDSIKEASETLGVRNGTIWYCCKNKSTVSTTNYLWRYIEDVDENLLKISSE